MVCQYRIQMHLALFLKTVIKNVRVTTFVNHDLQLATFNYIVIFTFTYEVFVTFFRSFNYDQRRWFEILYIDLSRYHQIVTSKNRDPYILDHFFQKK